VRRTSSAASQPPHHDSYAGQIELRGNITNNEQKGEAVVYFMRNSKVKRYAASLRILIYQRELSRTPVGPSGKGQGTGSCVSKGVILESAASFHPSLRTVTLP